MRHFSPLLAFVALSCVVVNCVNCTSYYTVVAPEHIRPHSDYKISITIHNDVQPTTIHLSIVDDADYKNEKEVTIRAGETKLVTLPIGELDTSKGYKLKVEGISGEVFKEESNLKIESKNLSIFIQTDKAIYKPGEKVKFRVLVLDYELKPVALTPDNLPNIYLTDPKNNRIKQWLKVTPNKGVFSSEIQLSELPILGNWKFEVRVGKEVKSKEVEVAEYVLPKFDVTIDSPTEFSAKDSLIRAIIRSRYTFGKLVKGNAIVSLTKDGNENIASKTIPINGKGTAEFDVEKELNIEFPSYTQSMDLELKATVIEELTGRNHSTSKTITIHQSRYKITPSISDHKFTPGQPLVFEVSVSHHDNSPILVSEDTKAITIVKTKRNYGFPIPYPIPRHHWYSEYPLNIEASQVVTGRIANLEEEISLNFELDTNGQAHIEIPTSNNETDFNLKVKYMGEETDLGNFAPESTNEPAELGVKILTKRPTLNEILSAEVYSKHLLENFTYQVIANGKLIYAENVILKPIAHNHIIEFNATFDLFPKATLIVYRFKEDDIVANSTEISIEEDLNNFVKVTLSAAETQPGKDVSIDVITNPDSHVGLVGVDQSVLLLKKNDGLTKDDVKQDRAEYGERLITTQSDYKPHYTNDYFKPFENNKFILITNAKKNRPRAIYFDNYWPYHGFLRFGGGFVGGYGGLAAPAMGYSAGVVNSISFPVFPTSTIPPPPTSSSPPPPPPIAAEPPRVRKEFPETWLWEDFDVTNANGTYSLTKKVPDTITSWVISAFSVNPQKGLGLTKNPRSIKVFQPFFVSLNLPYSVKRGEVVAVPVILFNYLDTDVTAELTLHNENNEFEFLDGSNRNGTFRKRRVSVASDAGVSSTFLVRFTSVGKIALRVTATSAVAGDAMVRILQVDPEGVPQFVNKALFVDLRDSHDFHAVQTVDVPQNAVSGSLKINVNAVGDLLGGTIENLHELIRLPTGCGEQNMLKFVPDIVVLDYLIATENLEKATKDKALKFLLSGYQRELTYRREDGSFSVFGKSDRKGSTWLTAFVAKSFKQAENYIDIDEKIIDEALDFLSSSQASDGSFPEHGHIYDHAMQGGSGNGVALTAYVTIAFLRNKKLNDWKHQEAIDKALDNIASNLTGIDNPYAESIAAYALQLADHPRKDQVLNDLVSKSMSKDNQKWWTKSRPGSNESESQSIDIEITSYAVLALIEAKRSNEILPYFKWLLAQRNDKGGFFGTQDTVIGLEALASYARLISAKDNNVHLKIGTNTTEDISMAVKSENALVLQAVDLPSDTRSVNLTATGHGFALFQLSYRYNVKESDVYSAFILTPNVTQTTPDHLNVEICSRFNPKIADEKHSNMAIVEVAMPSGFLIEKDQVNKLTDLPHIKLVETKRGETVADVYIDRLTADENICFEVQGYRSHKVAENKPVPVRIYDYYDSSRSARAFYEIPKTSSCDICEDEECSKSC